MLGAVVTLGIVFGLGFMFGALWYEERLKRASDAMWERVKAQIIHDATNLAAASEAVDARARMLPEKLRRQQYAVRN